MKHYFGSIYLKNKEYYILAEVDKNKAGLVVLKDGNRWSDPKEVDMEKDCNYELYISEEDFDMVAEHCYFVLVHSHEDKLKWINTKNFTITETIETITIAKNGNDIQLNGISLSKDGISKLINTLGEMQ